MIFLLPPIFIDYFRLYINKNHNFFECYRCIVTEEDISFSLSYIKFKMIFQLHILSSFSCRNFALKPVSITENRFYDKCDLPTFNLLII